MTVDARWLAAYRKADTLYTARECGCLVFVIVDLPAELRDARDTILRESLAGRALHRGKRGELPPLHCSEHAVTSHPITSRSGGTG